MSVSKRIDKAKKGHWKICLYGLGLIGSSFGEECLSYFSLHADYYSDRDKNVLERYCVPSGNKISPSELLEVKENTLVFVFCGNKYIESIVSFLASNSYLHIITFQELCECDEVIEKYFGLNTKLRHDMPNIKAIPLMERERKTAVYTCIIGGYDRLMAPCVIEDDCDYYLITDVERNVKIENEEYYKRVPVTDVVPANLTTPKAQNRYCKSHGFEIFKQYEYSVYLDGCLQIAGKMTELVERIGKYGIATHKFPGKTDIYSHAMSLSIESRIRRDDANIVMEEFASSGLPRGCTFPECTVIVSDHKNLLGRQILSEWNDLYNSSRAKRDQLYMAYILWQRGIQAEEICTLPGNLRNNGYFNKVSFHKGFQE